MASANNHRIFVFMIYYLVKNLLSILRSYKFFTWLKVKVKINWDIYITV